MNKKVLACLGLITGVLLVGSISYAEELKESLEMYLIDP